MELLAHSVGLIFWTVFCFLLLFAWVIALIDILKNDFRSVNDKLIWVLVVLLAPFIGTLLYFTIGKKNKINQT